MDEKQKIKILIGIAIALMIVSLLLDILAIQKGIGIDTQGGIYSYAWLTEPFGVIAIGLLYQTIFKSRKVTWLVMIIFFLIFIWEITTPIGTTFLNILLHL